MKKIASILLALAMLLTLGAAAMAETYTDMETVTITKVYTLTNDGTTSPAETFTLEQVGSGVVTDGEATEAPDLVSISSVTYAEGAATTDGTLATITITLPEYTSVGVYTYTLQEVAGTSAGVTYYGETITLVVTVINDEDGNIRVAAVHTETGDGDEKSDSFENTYSAGELSVTKSVTGNLGDTDKYFEFTITLTGEDGVDYNGTYTVTGGSYEGNPTEVEISGTYTFYLKDGETITFENLPYGVTYTVVETDYSDDGYTTTCEGDTGTISSADATASFVNAKDTTVDTGVSTDSLPYILVLGAVVLLGAAMMIGKRRAHND